MHLPGPLRAAVGLAAAAANEAKHLPDRAIELPMLVVSSALQASLRAQQRYARLTARGDEVLNRRTPTSQPPPWATFDEPVSVGELRRPDSPAGPLGNRSRFEQLFGVEDPTLDPAGREPIEEFLPPDEPAPITAAPSVPSAMAQPVVSPAAPKQAVPKPAGPKRAAKGSASTKAAKTTAKQTADKAAKPRAKKSVAAADPAAIRAKTVSKPRHTAPSAFDNVIDD